LSFDFAFHSIWCNIKKKKKISDTKHRVEFSPQQEPIDSYTISAGTTNATTRVSSKFCDNDGKNRSTAQFNAILAPRTANMHAPLTLLCKTKHRDTNQNRERKKRERRERERER
jgi:hypothetical protein